MKDFDAVTLVAATPSCLRSIRRCRRNRSRNWSRDPRHARQIQLRVARHRHAAATGGRAVSAQSQTSISCTCRLTAAVPPSATVGRSYADLVRRHGAGGAADQGRELRALAVTGKERSPALPDIPTMAEAGFPEVEGSTWTAIVVPAGTPKDIIAELHRLIVNGLAATRRQRKTGGDGLCADRRLARRVRGVLQVGNDEVGKDHQGRGHSA